MRRQFFPRRKYRIPYNVILIVAVLALAIVLVLAFRFLMPACQV